MANREISIEEMVMGGFRIMRNGDCKKAKELRAELCKTFPDADAKRIDDVMQKLADIARKMA